jgi:glycosyltransferase involved in cell wall biosynthesis
MPIDGESFMGGVQTATAGLLEGLAAYREEFEFHVVSPCTDIANSIHGTRDGVQYHFLGGLHRRWLRPRLPLRVYKVWREIRRLQPDLVHCQANPDLVLAAVLAGRRPVFTMHGVAEREAPLRTGLQVWSEHLDTLLSRLVRRQIVAFICVSNYVETQVDSHALTVSIPNAVSSEFLVRATPAEIHEPPYFVFLGVIAPLKRPADLHQAHAELRRSYPDLRTYFGGPVEDEQYAGQLERKVSEEGIQGVHFEGGVSQSTVVELLSNARALVVPSAHENAPMSIAEAMACGVPVVATRVGGIPEMVEDGRTGFLFDVGDVAGLTRHLQTLLEHPDLVRRMGEQGKAIACVRYAPECVGEATVGVYRWLLRKGRMEPGGKAPA